MIQLSENFNLIEESHLLFAVESVFLYNLDRPCDPSFLIDALPDIAERAFIVTYIALPEPSETPME